jgi:RHH-type rel operon transcriptional repressor/antitoxin RelB
MAKEIGSSRRNTVTISARIPAELGEMLSRVSRKEERSKSYYIRKSLELFLMSKLEDIEDYEEAKRFYREFVASGEKLIPFSEIKKKHDL